MLPRSAILAALLAAPCAFAQPAAVPSAESRGAMLYDTHCITCHTTQMHWREQRLATDWDSLRLQVRRWQGNAGLSWSEEDIDAVAKHLNDTIYRFPPATQTSRR